MWIIVSIMIVGVLYYKGWLYPKKGDSCIQYYWNLLCKKIFKTAPKDSFNVSKSLLRDTLNVQGDTMRVDEREIDEGSTVQVVFEPAQCKEEVEQLIQKFIGIESNFDISELEALIEKNSSGNRMHQAIDELKAHLTLPLSDALVELSVEEYIVEIECSMREYVALIITASQQGHEVLHKTETLLNKIDSIFSLVDGLRHIADQTGLLALNAAIEAAKAGHTGRSYSYMAKEVQKLSKQSDHFGVGITKEMLKAKNAVQASSTLVDQMVVSDVHIALETRSSVDQLIGQIQGLSVSDMVLGPRTSAYGAIIKEMHKIIVVVLMKIDLIERLGLVDLKFKNKISSLNKQLKILYLAKVIKN